MGEQDRAERVDGADRVGDMTTALLKTFGDRAHDVARRQIETGGEAVAVWHAIASRLASANPRDADEPDDGGARG